MHGVPDHAAESHIALPKSSEIPPHRLSKFQCNSYGEIIRLFTHEILYLTCHQKKGQLVLILNIKIQIQLVYWFGLTIKTIWFILE